MSEGHSISPAGGFLENRPQIQTIEAVLTSLAVILAGILHGLEQRLQAAPPVNALEYDSYLVLA